MGSDLRVSNPNQWTPTILELENLHGIAAGHAKESILAGIQIGEILTRVKGALKHGQWLPWIEELAPFSQPMAWYYVAAYERRDEIKAKLLMGNNFNYKLLLNSESNGTGDHRPQELHESNFYFHSIKLTQRLMGDINHELKDHPMQSWEKDRLISLAAALEPLATLFEDLQSLIKLR